jgi:peptidoglycan/xylan/chitin deacetylase (PgdA/CDA1 family)
MSEATVAFEASAPFLFFDYFRVPYRVVPDAPSAGPHLPDGTAQLRAVPARGPRLLWAQPGPQAPVQLFSFGDILLAGRVLPDDALAGALAKNGWRRTEPLIDGEGRQIGAIWRDERDGSVLLPFDPGEVMTTLWSERYRDAGSPAWHVWARRAALRGYYLARPAIPRSVQLRLRRSFTRVQGRAVFPRWPVESGLHDLYEWIFAQLATLAGGPVPSIGLWPDGRSWAMVLTHDVETEEGLRRMELLREPERQLGLRSSWNLVPQRYRTDPAVVQALKVDGCEVGVHGLRHDGRDLGSRRLLRRRLPAMRRAADRWGAVGFRSPATQRNWAWMPDLGFEYDTSSTDTDPYEPQPGGCCTVLPFFNRDLVELPITLPQDHTLFTILALPDGELWCDKARRIRELGGMALVLTHPDYAIDQHAADAYRALLDRYGTDPTAWHALPREVAQWWRLRAQSSLRYTAGEWRIDGPAADRGIVQLNALPAGHAPGRR